MRLLSRSCLLLVATGLCASAAATNVYQWKDSKGVTHSSDSPPPGAQYDTRRIDNRGDAVEEAEAPAETEVSSQCATARMNLATLSSGSPVQQDTDGDGKPDKVLDDEERATHKNLAETAVKAYCPPAG
jgi:hypothetical protein